MVTDWPVSDAVDRQQHDNADDDTEHDTNEHRHDDTCQREHVPLQHSWLSLAKLVVLYFYNKYQGS